jgi:hypothetical protein
MYVQVLKHVGQPDCMSMGLYVAAALMQATGIEGEDLKLSFDRDGQEVEVKRPCCKPHIWPQHRSTGGEANMQTEVCRRGRRCRVGRHTTGRDVQWEASM